MSRILVLGAGSVGKRHLRNLAGLGCEVAAMDPRDDRLDEAATEVPLAARYTTLESAIADAGRYNGVVVASPPKYHLEQAAAALGAGLHVLLEKPATPTLAEASELARIAESSTARLLLGYTYRWWEPLRDFRSLIAEGVVGTPLSARFVMSAHLADWHPWEAYTDFFMASRELGGGALLDESHFVDLMLWFFGVPDRVYAQVEKLSSLDIETDDTVEMIASWTSGLRANMHLDLFGRPHEKYIVVTGEGGTIEWSFEPNRVRWSSDMGQDAWQERTYDYERNDMFVSCAAEFLEVITGAEPSCTARDGADVLRVLEAARASSDTGAAVVPPEG